MPGKKTPAAGFVLLAAAALAACGSEEPRPLAPQEEQRLAAREERLHGVCSAPATFVRLKELVFDEAARLRGGGASTLDRVASGAQLTLREPVTATGDPDGVVVCSGRLLIELPVSGPAEPRRLAAEVEYAAQAARDGSGLVFEMEGADMIVRDLAALGGMPPAPSPEPRPQREIPFDGTHRAGHSTGPSFDCAFARLPSERLICASRPLSRLDREMASLYYDQMAQADERRRDLLRRTRDSFLARRDRCREAGCVASVYEDRIAEIRSLSQAR